MPHCILGGETEPEAGLRSADYPLLAAPMRLRVIVPLEELMNLIISLEKGNCVQ